MPYPNWHAARIVDPDSFIASSFRNKTIADGIELILGKKTEDGPMETQAVRFDKDKFTPEEARKWLKDNDYSPISFEKASEPVGNLASVDNEGSFSHSSHDITLQRLDTLLPYPGVASGKLKYNVDNFAGTERAWDRTLAVFVPKGVPVQHVDHRAFANDPHREAARLGFRIVGHHTDTKVISNGPGEPRVITKAVFTDPEVDRLATEGKLSLSSGFDARVLPEGLMEGQVAPNHVLYFLRNEKTAFGSPATPNDGSAMVNNLSEETMTDEDTKGTLSKILEAVTPKTNPLQATVDNLTAEVQKRDAKIDALTKENEALKAAKTSLDNLMAEQANKAKDARWAQIKNLLKPGLYHKPEDEKALRDAFEADAGAFMIANIGNLQTVKPSPAKGAEAVGNLGEDDGKPFDTGAARGKLNPATGRFE